MRRVFMLFGGTFFALSGCSWIEVVPLPREPKASTIEVYYSLQRVDVEAALSTTRLEYSRGLLKGGRGRSAPPTADDLYPEFSRSCPSDSDNHPKVRYRLEISGAGLSPVTSPDPRHFYAVAANSRGLRKLDRLALSEPARRQTESQPAALVHAIDRQPPSALRLALESQDPDELTRTQLAELADIYRVRSSAFGEGGLQSDPGVFPLIERALSMREVEISERLGGTVSIERENFRVIHRIEATDEEVALAQFSVCDGLKLHAPERPCSDGNAACGPEAVVLTVDVDLEDAKRVSQIEDSLRSQSSVPPKGFIFRVPVETKARLKVAGSEVARAHLRVPQYGSALQLAESATPPMDAGPIYFRFRVIEPPVQGPIEASTVQAGARDASK